MVIDRRKAALFVAASALRLLLFLGFPSLPDLLTGRVEISTPVTSFKRCMSSRLILHSLQVIHADEPIVQEGLFLYTHSLSPYDGGVFYQANDSFIKSSCLGDADSAYVGTFVTAVIRARPFFGILHIHKHTVYFPGSSLRQRPHKNCRLRPIFFIPTIYFLEKGHKVG